MSPKNSGAPKKPRWSQAKKASASRRPDAPSAASARKPFRRNDDRDDTRRSGGFRDRDDRPSYGRRDDRGESRGFERRDNRSEGGPRGRFESDRSGGRSYGRPEDRGNSRGPARNRHEDVDGGWAAGRGRSERDNRGSARGDDTRESRPFNRGGDRTFNRGESRGFERRDDRGGYQRRDDRGSDRNSGGYPRRDDRGAGGYQNRDDRGPSRYGQRDDRSQNRYERRDSVSRDERYPRRDNVESPRRDNDSSPRRDDRRFEDRSESPAPRREHHAAPADAPVARAEQLRRKEAPVSAPVDLETNGFALLGVPEPMVRRLARDGIATPFPIQEATIPDALAGRDVLGRGRTGSGKTLAFGLPMLARLAENGKATPNKPRAIVLSPTRELAMQISDALQPLVHVMGLRHKLVAGGMPYPPQFEALERGVDVLIATPGRLSDLIERGACSLEACQIVVLDEADHMADMGFLPEVTELLDQVPVGGQRLLFSATLDKGIDTLVEAYLNDPVTHSTDDAQASVTTMAHHVLLVDPAHKKVVTAHVANRGGHTIVFVRTKLGADRVAMQLREEGVFAAALHGGLSQAARNRVLAGFKDGTVPVLVATDVAARGIHVDDVGVVLQVDPPADHKDYLHRAGRTARAGEDGTVVTLALPHQKRQMQRIAEQAGVDLTPERIAPGDPRLHEITGSHRPDGPPIPEDRLRRLMEPPARPRRGGGYRGQGGGGRGGYRGGSGGGGYRGNRG